MALLSARKKLAARVAGGLAAALALAAGAFVWWASTPLGPAPEALDALRSDATVSVRSADGLMSFSPAEEPAYTGVVLYPGGRVDYRSYAPLAREIASRGYVVVVPEVPLNLAVFEPDAADRAMRAHPDVSLWAVGGHSLGGAMAAQYAEENPDRVVALVLLAAYPAGNTDLSDNDIAAVSLFGTKDGVLSEDGMERSVDLLPEDTDFHRIEGGNHAQFGSYGHQPGDNDAQLSAEDQQREAAEAIALLMRGFRLRTLTP